MGTPAPTLPLCYPSSLLHSASFVFLPRLDLMVQFAQIPHRCVSISHPVSLSPFPHVTVTLGYFSLNPFSCHSQVPGNDRGSRESVLKGCRSVQVIWIPGSFLCSAILQVSSLLPPGKFFYFYFAQMINSIYLSHFIAKFLSVGIFEIFTYVNFFLSACLPFSSYP